ncbi:MAG: hypothetical protein ACTSXJ_05830 [Candidatus Baldrarchaeia archaeon]
MKVRNFKSQKQIFFIIEHLEPVLSKWLWYEYKHAAEIVGYDKIIFTNVRDANEARKLAEIGSVLRFSIKTLPLDQNAMIILDPAADKELCPEDFDKAAFIVIGGILGDHPPRGRTQQLLSKFFPRAAKRNLGKHQFSIDGATYMALMVSKGMRLLDIPVKVGVEIQLDDITSIELPFAYPLVNGRPFISDELIEYLKSKEMLDEEYLLRTGKVRTATGEEKYLEDLMDPV